MNIKKKMSGDSKRGCEHTGIHHTLDLAWLAGMMGQIEIPGKPVALFVLHPKNLIPVALKKPARGMKDGELTETEREEQVIQAGRKLLAKGVPLASCAAPIKELQKTTLIISRDASCSTNQR